MSKLKIEYHKTVEINGVSYSADINKEIEVDFSSARYSVKVNEDDPDDDYIELIPDNLDFLHEITKIFPVFEYEIKITEFLFSSMSPYVSIDVCISNKETGDIISSPDGVTLSDKDYVHFWNVLSEALPQYKLLTSKERIAESIESCLRYESKEDLFTDKAIKYLRELICKKYDEFKIAGYDDCDFDAMKDVAKQMLEEALCNATK